MNKITKMAFIDKKRETDHDRYEVDDRFRDRRGRDHYDNGRYAPMNDGGMWVDYRRDSNGRYIPARSESDERRMDYVGMDYPRKPYVPPVYEDKRRREEYRPMNKIGFSIDGEMDKIPQEFDNHYHTSADYQNMNEVSYRRGNKDMAGRNAYTAEMVPFTKRMAEEWTREMENEDGTTGPHWTQEQTKQVQTQRGIDCDPMEFWVAINAIYSDYSKVAKKNNVNTIDFYADMAKAFLDDKDAVEDKLAAYYEYVVKH